MKTRLLILLVTLSLLSINIKAGIEDTCGTTSGSSGPFLPTSGTIKVYVIFAQFKDDPNTDNYGWAKDSYPDWANTFVNSSTGGTYPWNNLSQYFNEMSNGAYQVIGDVYDALVITDYNQSYYSSIGKANREIIQKVDPYVNFAEYDNLNGSVPGTDGKVDFIYIIYRNVTGRTLMSYSGIAQLFTDQTITVDGKQIINNWLNIGGGVQQRGGYNGRDYTLYVSAHEMGHYLFGGGHIGYTTNLCLMSGTGEPVWNGSKGMHSWERHKLGWISYTDKSTDGSITMSDYMTTDQVYRVPISNSEYFLIENRKKLSSHDYAGDVGFYFYRITGAVFYPPSIDVLCADGNWDFDFNTSTLKITRLDQNPASSKDEMNFKYSYDSNGDGVAENYACYTPVYSENAAWGDNEDAFDLTFNNVLSPASNPRSTNGLSTNFSIEVTGENTLTFYFTNPYGGSPSKPQNLHLTYANQYHPSLGWDVNTEPDISSYKIYRSYDNTAFDYAGTVTHPTNTFIDNAVSYTKPIWEKSVKYYVVAVDNTNKTSVPSNQVESSGIIDPLPKINEENYAEEKTAEEVVHGFRLYDNYPDPFNPTTIIKYQLPEAGFVTLKVYDILGREVAQLVNETKSAGNYEVNFDASKLTSGVYIYTIQSGKYMESKKMILTK